MEAMIREMFHHQNWRLGRGAVGLPACLLILLGLVVAVLADDSGGMVFSPDGKWMAVGWHDGRIEIRDGRTGEVRHAIRHEGVPEFKEDSERAAVSWTPDFAISPDGKKLASSSGYAPVVIWNPETGEKIVSLDGSSVGYDLSFSPDGSRIVGTGVDGKAGPRRLTLWDADTGETLNSMTIDFWDKEGRNGFRVVRFARTSSSLLVETFEEDRHYLRIWDGKAGRETMKVSADLLDRETGNRYPGDWALSPDGSRLTIRQSTVTGGWPGKHTLYDTDTGKIVKAWQKPAGGN